MRGTILLLAVVLAGCAASNAANAPDAPPQAADWRHRDSTPVSAAEFAGRSEACQQQVAADRPVPLAPPTLETTHSENWARGVAPAPSTGVAVPSISGNTVPMVLVPPPRSVLVDRCLEEQGLMPAH